MRAVFKAIWAFLREADIFLLALGLISAVFGIIQISSVVKNLGGSDVLIQSSALVIGIILFVILSYLDIDIIADKTVLLFMFSVLFIMTLLVWGVGGEETGNKAWLRFFGIGIQPTEIVKITFIIILAKMISNFKERKSLNSIGSIARIVFVFAVIFGLIVVVSDDLGSALVYAFVFIVMLYVGGVKLRWFALGAALAVPASLLVWNNYLTEEHKNRILVLFIPDQIDPARRDTLWQTDYSVRAITSGGFSGQGLGNGRITQAGIIPHQRTDFIFSAAGEELGFVGCMLIILLLVTIIIRCVYVGVKSNNPLGMLVCTGIASMLIAQTLENIGMCLGILPVVGITLPFFSYGGSSIVASMAAMGIVSGIKMRPKPVRFRSI